MFDLRYHVASLAAVFLALIIGILVGVGITRGGFVSKAERKVLNNQINSAVNRANTAESRVSELEQSQRADQSYVNDTYLTLVKNRLAGDEVALVSVGAMDGTVRTDVAQALTDAGAPLPLRIRSVKVPIDDKALDAVLAGKPAFGPYVGAKRLSALGRELGSELVRGGKTPLWEALAGQLVEERIGAGRPPVAGVIVMRSVKPQQDGTARFLDGFYAGLATAGVPAVGVEPSRADPSAVPAFQRAGLSTVDSIDTPAGKLALVLVLAGGEPGDYGLRRTDKVIPPLASVPAPTTTTGG